MGATTLSSFDNKKELRFVITLGNGQTFQGGSSNQITLEGYRAIVNIDKAGGGHDFHALTGFKEPQ